MLPTVALLLSRLSGDLSGCAAHDQSERRMGTKGVAGRTSSANVQLVRRVFRYQGSDGWRDRLDARPWQEKSNAIEEIPQHQTRVHQDGSRKKGGSEKRREASRKGRAGNSSSEAVSQGASDLQEATSREETSQHQ